MNTRTSSSCRIYVGTSGYAYTEWVESGFYPDGISAEEMLTHYTRRFALTELTTTGYQLPRAETLARCCRRTPEHFRFAVRLIRSLTHEIDFQRWPELAARYRDGLAPLQQYRRLAAVLLQWPPSFDRTPTHRRYLASLLEALDGLPLAVEFRHGSWATASVRRELQRRQVALVATDAPPLPELFPPLGTTANPDFFCARFYGRNAAGWRSGKTSIQFDYDYGEAELAKWVEHRLVPLARSARRGLLLFHNYVRAQAPRDAVRMMQLLREKGFAVV